MDMVYLQNWLKNSQPIKSLLKQVFMSIMSGSDAACALKLSSSRNIVHKSLNIELRSS